jgi:hypothetical protein
MVRRSLAPLIAVLVLLATANASLTEVRKDFLNQTATFPATSVMTAPTADGSYLVMAYVDQPAGGTVFATLRWTDENGELQHFQVFGGSAVFSIRLQAGAALTIETAGTVNGSYNLLVNGVGFWN